MCSVWCVCVGECVDVCVGIWVHYQRALLKKTKRSCQLSLYQTAGGAPLKNSKWRLPSIVTEVCVDRSKDSVVSIPVKNRYHPPPCSSPKPSSYPLFSLLSISNPSEKSVLLQNIFHIPPLLPTSTDISVLQSLSPLTRTKPPQWSPCLCPCCPTVFFPT